jgi:hypothetical protein
MSVTLDVGITIQCSRCKSELDAELTERYGTWTLEADPCETCLQESAEKGVV